MDNELHQVPSLSYKFDFCVQRYIAWQDDIYENYIILDKINRHIGNMTINTGFSNEDLIVIDLVKCIMTKFTSFKQNYHELMRRINIIIEYSKRSKERKMCQKFYNDTMKVSETYDQEKREFIDLCRKFSQNNFEEQHVPRIYPSDEQN